MRTIVIIGFTAGLFAAALPAHAANSNTNTNAANTNRSDQASRERGQASAAANDPNRQICVVEPRSESRIRRPVCHTAREWRDLQGDENQS